MTVGDNVNYPGQGPCRIDRIANRVIDGKTVAFYHLVVLVDGGELYVPVDKAGTIGVRPLLNRSEIPRLLETLKEISDSEKPETATNSKQRSIDNLRLLSTGSAFHLAEIVRSLAELRNTKALGLRETQILDKARRLLIAEIAVVLDETMSEAEERVDNSLEAPD
jgi:CarD family transcriptional regulator